MGTKWQRLRRFSIITGLGLFLLFYNCNLLLNKKSHCTISATLLINYSNWNLGLALPAVARRNLFPPNVLQFLVAQKRKRRKTVVIIAQGRSGSSFLGQIFNQHPDVFYLYEPMYNLEQVENLDSFRENTTGRYDQLAGKYLRELISCSFGNERYLEYMSRYGHFRFSSRVLRSAPFCHPSAINAEPRAIISERLCDLLTQDGMERVCKTYKTSVIKLLTHRIPGKNIEYLLKKFSSLNHDLLVIHLVRDPRDVIFSMWKGGWIGYLDENRTHHQYTPTRHEFHWFVQRICSMTADNLKIGINPPSWINGKYKLLRYEDFVRHPQQVAEALYKFTGLSMLTEITKWLYETTHPKVLSAEGTDDPYSIRRDPRSVVEMWRTEFDEYTIRIIEKYCASVMTTLDYQPI